MASTADIRMNQATVASDGSYVYAEAADGSLVKIAKTDLVEMIKTLLPNLLFYKRTLGINDDLNTLRESGIYDIYPEAGDAGNIPFIAARGYIISVYRSNCTLQLFFGGNAGGAYFRVRINDEAWPSWGKLS